MTGSVTRIRQRNGKRPFSDEEDPQQGLVSLQRLNISRRVFPHGATRQFMGMAETRQSLESPSF